MVEVGAVGDRHQPGPVVPQPGPLPEVLPDPNGDVLEHVLRVVPVGAEPPQQPQRPRSMSVEQRQEGFTVRGHVALVTRPRREPAGAPPLSRRDANCKTGLRRKVFDRRRWISAISTEYAQDAASVPRRFSLLRFGLIFREDGPTVRDRFTAVTLKPCLSLVIMPESPGRAGGRTRTPQPMEARLEQKTDRKNLVAQQKALAINLDPRKYGTFAEIGAGQEVVRWFFQVGGAAGTIAKSISAYDMTVSDAIYGPSPRYVSRDRLQTMLDYEYELLRNGSRRVAGPTPTSSSSPTRWRPGTLRVRTSATAGWGSSFRRRPRRSDSQIVVHVRMLDKENVAPAAGLGDHRRQSDLRGVLP